MVEVDLVNRDPNNLNDHLQVSFEDVLAEPEGIRSMDCVWKLSYRCFNLWRDVCYKLITLLCGICIAAEWGCAFAYTAVEHIWCITPTFKNCQIYCVPLRKCSTLCMDCMLGPLCETCGLVLSKIKITKG